MKAVKKSAKILAGILAAAVLMCMPVYAAIDADDYEENPTANETVPAGDEELDDDGHAAEDMENNTAEPAAPVPISGERNPDTGLKGSSLPGIVALFSAGIALIVIGDKLTKRKE